MTITINGTPYPVELEQNALAQSIRAMCPTDNRTGGCTWNTQHRRKNSALAVCACR